MCLTQVIASRAVSWECPAWPVRRTAGRSNTVRPRRRLTGAASNSFERSGEARPRLQPAVPQNTSPRAVGCFTDSGNTPFPSRDRFRAATVRERSMDLRPTKTNEGVSVRYRGINNLDRAFNRAFSARIPETVTPHRALKHQAPFSKFRNRDRAELDRTGQKTQSHPHLQQKPLSRL